MLPFTPTANTVNVGATTSTGSVALGTQSGQGGATVRIVNSGAVLVFINFGISTVEAATATSLPVLPNAAEVFSIGPGVTHMAAITASGTATVYATLGQGV